MGDPLTPRQGRAVALGPDKLEKDQTPRAFGENLSTDSGVSELVARLSHWALPVRSESRQVIEVKGWRSAGRNESCQD